MAGEVNPLKVPAEQQRKAIAAAVTGFVLGVGGVVSSGGSWKAALIAGIVGAVGAYSAAFGFTNEKPPQV